MAYGLPPSHAAWFDANGVHEIERRALPEFFQPERTLKKQKHYIEARNFVIATYREQPTLFLSVTECRRHLSLDASTVMRIHQFLEYWGLVNYVPQPHCVMNGNVVQEGGLKRSRAASSGVGLSTRADLFTAGASNAVLRSSWNNDATLALLEGVEQFEDRWEEVAAHVGKTPEDCARYFLRLPMEEPQHPEAFLGEHALLSSSRSDFLTTHPLLHPSTIPCPRHIFYQPQINAWTYSRPSRPLGPHHWVPPRFAPAAVGEAAGGTVVDPQLSQLALLSRVVKGTDAPQAVIKQATVAASSGMHDVAHRMLKATQERAQQQVAEEERQMQQLCTGAVETQLQRLEAKIGTVDQLAALLQKEREQLERSRSQIFAERLQAMSSTHTRPPHPSALRSFPPYPAPCCAHPPPHPPHHHSHTPKVTRPHPRPPPHTHPLPLLSAG